METDWVIALKDIPLKKVSVSIKPLYSKNSMRLDSIMVEYEFARLQIKQEADTDGF